MQAYAVMEDDSRDWDKNRKRLLEKLLNPKARANVKIDSDDSQVDWQRVADLAHTPRAVPVPVTGGREGLDAVLSQSLLVQNTLPEGSNWDGKSGLLVDEKTFNDLVNGKNQPPPGSESAPESPGSAAPSSAAPAPAAAPRATSPRAAPGAAAPGASGPSIQ
jgi:hypothetical protein